MPQPFTKVFQVGWRDLDSNGHVKNTAYLEMAVDVRMIYFEEHDFTMREFEQLRLGPVMSHDELEYYRELKLLDKIRVNFTLAGSSDDGSRFRVRNEFFREDGKRAARVTSTGGWMDLSARKLIVPPERLMEAVRRLVKSEDFELLKNSATKRRDQMNQSIEEKNKILVLDAFETLFNKRDYAAAERYWSPKYIQHSAHIPPGREGLFGLIKNAPATLRYENQLILANGDWVMLHGRYSGLGPGTPNWIVADIVRVESGVLAEHWDVIQDEATRASSKSGLPMFGDKFSE